MESRAVDFQANKVNDTSFSRSVAFFEQLSYQTRNKKLDQLLEEETKGGDSLELIIKETTDRGVKKRKGEEERTRKSSGRIPE